MKLSKVFIYAFTLTLGIFTGFVAVAWTGPTGTAPNNNVGAPLNVSSTAQSKAGGLVVNTGGATNGLIVYGKVGIGTASPNSGLEVSAASPNGGIRVSGTTNPYIGLADGTNQAYVEMVGGRLRLYNNGYEGLAVNNLGQVVIGTTVPYGASGLTLDHGGSGSWAQIVNYFNGSPSGSYGLWVHGSVYAINADGPVYATAFYYSSDARLKKNIETIASSTALAKVLALNPVTYNWIAKDKPQGTQIGFIAQEVEKVVPELILTDPQTGYKGVDYARVVPLLTGAIQEQQAQIDAQQRQIDELKAEVEALKVR